MLPDLTVLLALLIGLSRLEGAPDQPWRAFLGSLLCFVVGGALSRMTAARGLRALEQEDVLAAESSARWATLWPFLAWLGALILFEWGAWVNVSVPRLWWVARYIVLLAPMVAMFAVAWSAKAEVQGALIAKRGGVPSLRGAKAAIVAGLRRNAIALAPLFLLLGLIDAIWVAGELGVESLRTFSLWAEAMPLASVGLMLVIILVTLPFLPRIIARLIGAKPMAPGPMRSELERAADAIDLRYGQIMIWPTGGRLLNAMVVGFTGRSRMIFLTDALIDAMPADEVMAVFFHEAGHAKKQHLPLFLVMFLALALLFEEIRVPLMAIGVPLELQLLLHLALLWFVLLGWISRRFERESDVYGAEHATVLEPDAAPVEIQGLPAPIPKGSALMIGALRRIQTIMGYAGGHRHGTVDDRVAFLMHHALEPEVRTQFRAGMSNLKRGIFLLLGVAVAVAVWRFPLSLAHAHAEVDRLAANRIYEEALPLAHARRGGDPEKARALFQQAYELFESSLARVGERDDALSRELRLQGHYATADIAMHGVFRPEDAERHYRKVLELLDLWEFNSPQAAIIRFECQIDLGRIAAWKYAALPVGDPGRDRTEMDRRLARARKLRDLEISQLPGERTLKDDAFLAARARLLAATIDAAVGEVALAREQLTRLARIADAAKSTAWGRFEIAEAARRELAKLPPPKPGTEGAGDTPGDDTPGDDDDDDDDDDEKDGE